MTWVGFGHKVRGLLAVLKDGLVETNPLRNFVDFVNGENQKFFWGKQIRIGAGREFVVKKAG